MAEFQLICLDGEELALVDRIMKSVEGVTSTEGAVRWALKRCATQPLDVQLEVKPSTRKSRRTPSTTFELPKFIDLKPGEHTVSVRMSELFNEVAQSEHTVMMAPSTLERLVPDKGRWPTLLRPGSF